MKALKRLCKVLLRRATSWRARAAPSGARDARREAVEGRLDGLARDNTSVLCDASGRKYVAIFESELRVMAGIAAEWAARGLETVQEIYGLLSQGGRAVILLVTAPGPNAAHRRLFCQQDLEFFRRTSEAIGRRLGLQVIGSEHLHLVDLPHESGFDEQQVRDFTARNNFSCWVQIITTVHDGRVSRPSGRSPRKGVGQKDLLRIAVHTFLYTDPQRGQKVDIPLRVMPGMSPMRLSALAGGILDPADIGQSYCDFPMDRIVYNAFDFDAHYPQQDTRIPETLALVEQFQELPEEVQNNIQICADAGRDSVVVALPLPGSGRVSIAYSRVPTHAIESISLGDGENRDTEAELSALFVGQRGVALRQIYETLVAKRRPATHGVCRLESGDAASGTRQEQGHAEPGEA